MNSGPPEKYSSIAALIFDQSEKQPEALAVIGNEGISFSYKELRDMLVCWHCSLQAHGLGHSSRVAVVMPQGVALGVVFLATAASATFVPLNPQYTKVEFVHYLGRMKVAALLTITDAFPHAVAAAMEMRIPVLNIQNTGNRLALENSDISSKQIKETSVVKFQSSQDIALLLHTSGSTANPKLVALTQAQILCSARSIVRSLDLNSKDRSLNSMPLFHVGALVDLILAPLVAGGSTIITTDSSAASFVDALINYQPTWYQGVPTMLQNIVNKNFSYETSSLRFIRAVSAPLAEKLLHDVEAAFGVPVIEMYGMTETAGLICSNPLPPASRKTGSVGLPVDHDILVLDDTGNSVAPFISGEILVRGKSVIEAYEEDHEFNRKQFSSGWFHTGDIGYRDHDGFLFITGRLKELINRGGEKISPAEIDRCLSLHEAVVEAGAFSVSHQTLGEDVCAAVVLTAKDAANEKELLRFLKGQLADFKIPRQIYFLEALPKNPSGKLLRSKIAECCFKPDADNNQDDFTAPDSELAVLLAGMWQKALKVDRVGLNDNFFELGGDSLKATTFLVELQEKLGSDVVIPSLYESPTIEEIEKDILMNTGRSPAELVASIAGISPEIYLDVYRAISAGFGKRRSPESLIFGRNTMGGKPPIFFSTGMDKQLLARFFGKDQPIYYMRSLLNLSSRSTENTLELAHYYAREIQEIQPEGPLIIGGFCEGGKIAFEVARELLASNRDVPLLFMIEQFVPRHYEGRIEMFFAEESRFNPCRYFQSPDKGWRKYYKGELAVTIYPWEHNDFLAPVFLVELVKKLQKDITLALGNDCPSGNKQIGSPNSDLQDLSDEDRLLKVVAKSPRIVSQEDTFILELTVTNLGNKKWLCYEESGLYLAVRWVDRENRKLGISGRANLNDGLKPGESTSLSVMVKTPKSIGFLMMDIDMVEEDVCFFQDVTYQSFSHRIFVGGIIQYIYHSIRKLLRF